MRTAANGAAPFIVFELLCGEPRHTPQDTRARISAELNLNSNDPRLDAWWNEAARVYGDAALRPWFDPAHYDAAYNEVPIQYQQGDAVVYGVIDRLVVHGDRCAVIDYKTHRGGADAPHDYAALFREQLICMRKAWHSCGRKKPSTPICCSPPAAVWSGSIDNPRREENN